MAKYAEIHASDNRVHVVFESDKAPEGNPAAVLYADITALSPQPEPGWLYDEKARKFIASAFPVVEVTSDPDADAVALLLAKSSATFTVSDLADVVKKIAKRIYRL